MPHIFDPTIIREYDIRGIVGKTLHASDALALGKAFGSMVARAGGKRISVGYDGRTHSPAFEAVLIRRIMGARHHDARIRFRVRHREIQHWGWP